MAPSFCLVDNTLGTVDRRIVNLENTVRLVTSESQGQMTRLACLACLALPFPYISPDLCLVSI